MTNDSRAMKIAAAKMRGQKMQIKGLIEKLFDDGTVPDSGLNIFLINLIIFFIKSAVALIRKGDVKLL